MPKKTKRKDVIVIPPETLLCLELLPADGAVEGGLLVELEVHPQGRVLRAHLSANVAPVRRRDRAFCLISDRSGRQYSYDLASIGFKTVYALFRDFRRRI